MSGWGCCRWACFGAAGFWANAFVLQMGCSLLCVSGLLSRAAQFHSCVPGDAPGMPRVLRLVQCGETLHFSTCRLCRHAAAHQAVC